MENAPLAFKCLRADSHHRFHSVSLKRSGTIHSLSSCAVAFPSRLSKMFRTSATGSSLASFLVAARSLALRTRKCSAGITVSFSAAYCSCIAFNAGVFVALTVDLVQFKHRGRELSMRAAAQRTAIWIILSLLFNLVVWKIRGPDKALEFLTGYVIEYSLSVDNIFVFILIFTYFRVPPLAQHRALVWGIVGALIMRGLMIWLGIELVNRFDFIVYTSNVCAILGLRSLYFLLAKLIDRFIYLKNGLAIVLAFVGAKMILRDVFCIPTPVSLAFIVITLTITIMVSVIVTRKRNTAAAE